MLSVISKAFGFSASQENIEFKPRQINLSGNIVSFSMPENFSKDMPAENMIESVNLSDQTVFEDPNKFTLIRRWWDFKSGGFFSKDYGSVMMSIYVKQVPDKSEYDILNPLGFIGTIIQNYNEINIKEAQSAGKSSVIYPDFYEAYAIKTIKSLNWYNFPVEKKLTNQLDINYAIPLTNKTYLVVEFSFAPSNDTPTRSFIDEHSRPLMDSIMNSFDIQYTNNSKLPALVKQPVDLQKLIADKFYLENK